MESRILVLLLTVGVALAALTGCGSSEVVQQRAAQPAVIEPEVERREISIADIDSENFEVLVDHRLGCALHRGATDLQRSRTDGTSARADGFGVPFSEYVNHIDANGIQSSIDALLNDEKIGAHIMDGFFADAGTPERYLNVHQAALGNLFELKHISPFANLTNRGDKGSMIGLGEGVELGEGAKLVAPVILGSFSKVGSGCVVGPNVVTGEGVILEKESHIRDSVIMAHTKLEPRSDFNSILASKNDRLDLKS